MTVILQAQTDNGPFRCPCERSEPLETRTEPSFIVLPKSCVVNYLPKKTLFSDPSCAHNALTRLPCTAPRLTTMPTIVKCPNPGCGSACSVGDGLTNQAVRCPRCGKPFVPSSVSATIAVDATLVGRYQTAHQARRGGVRDRVPRLRPAAGPRGRPQAAQARGAVFAQGRRALPAQGASCGQDAAPEHRARLRRRHARRQPLHRLGLDRRQDTGRPDSRGRHRAGARRRPGAATGRGARLCPPAECAAPRREAGQRTGGRPRPPLPDGLRPRRFDPAGAQPHDALRGGDGHPLVYVPRAGGGRYAQCRGRGGPVRRRRGPV